MNMTSATFHSEKTKNQLIRHAFDIGAELCRTAVWHQDSCNWLGLNYNFNSKQEFYQTLDCDFYSGTSGISFFLNHLHDATGEKIFGETASGAMNHAVQHANSKSKNPFGFYSSTAGIIYSLLDFYTITGNDFYFNKAKELLNQLLSADVAAAEIDIISGAAGCIFVLLYAHQLTNDNNCLQKAIDLGNYLIANAQTEKTGLSWKTLERCEKNLTGFSHGTAGIGLSLFTLYTFTNQIKFKLAAENAFKYEDAYFNAQLNNWPDFRINDAPPTKEITYANAWCHGAPGIGLSRLLSYLIVENKNYLDIADKTFFSVQEKLFADNNYSLCHGMFGNAEFLLLHSRIKKDEITRQAIQQKILDACAEVDVNGSVWKCGFPTLREEPGLLCGIAGIGNFLLRLAFNNKYDSGLYIDKLFIK